MLVEEVSAFPANLEIGENLEKSSTFSRQGKIMEFVRKILQIRWKSGNFICLLEVVAGLLYFASCRRIVQAQTLSALDD